MAVLDAAVRGGFVLLKLVLAPRLWRASPAPDARLGAALALGSAVYALQSALLARGPLQAWQGPLQAIMTGNPVVLLLLSWAMFDDDFALRPWQALGWMAWVSLGLGNCYGWRSPWLSVALESAPVAMAALALWPVMRFWRDDLVEARLRVRGRIVVGVVGYTVLSTALGLPASGASAPAWLRLLDAALLLLTGLAAAWPLLVIGPAGRFRPMPATDANAAPAPRMAVPDVPAVATPAPTIISNGDEDAADDLALRRVQRALADTQPWRREGLTIGRLAADLGLPEYRLRRVIHRRLGHRNFNAFLNSHRIAQAKAALADPTLATTPVLSLALDVGFQSLGPFNRAFKADTGVTPSDFRRRALGAMPAGQPNPAIVG